jgi:hypothetical protein
MEDLLDEILKAAEAGLGRLALFGALALPDICGALESADGKAIGPKFKAWFDKYITPMCLMPNRPPAMDGDVAYAYRCAMLHQARAQHPNLGYNRVLFIERAPGHPVIHLGIADGALFVDVPSFCRMIITGVRKWLDDVKGDPTFQANLDQMLRRYPNGMRPYTNGPVIT